MRSMDKEIVLSAAVCVVGALLILPMLFSAGCGRGVVPDLPVTYETCYWVGKMDGGDAVFYLDGNGQALGVPLSAGAPPAGASLYGFINRPSAEAALASTRNEWSLSRDVGGGLAPGPYPFPVPSTLNVVCRG